MKTIFLLVAIALSPWSFAQFDGAAGTPGSLAIHKDSSAIIAWANNCQVNRGWMDISNKSLGLASNGQDGFGAGEADGMSVVSLGDSGVATLAFNPSIANGPGPDFAVFENSFSANFLELAFVEVSSNGIDFFRFPATSNYSTDTQIGPFDDLSDPTLLNNLAGKYRGLFGTPFDLSELDTIQGLDITQITHVRIVDVVGSIDPSYGSEDINGNLINDPYPTDFPAGGFDLDGVGVIHQGPLSSGIQELPSFSMYPNPLSQGKTLQIESEEPIESITIFTISGTKVFDGNQDELVKAQLSNGAYIIYVNTESKTWVNKLIVEK
ncbi:MAG: hypothetical protein Crog4KO_21190 [Crocinitomicaceae bacterium]